MNKGEAADWIAELHEEEAPDLRFNNVAQQLEAETQIKALKQAGRPAKELKWEFRRLAGKLRDWPERLMVHTFKEALDLDLRQACGISRVLDRIQS